MSAFSHRMSLIGTENAFSIGSQIAKLEQQGHPITRLTLGEPDFDIPELIKTEIKHQLDLNNTHYCDPQGLLRLREAICEQLYRTRNLSVSPDRVVVLPGAKPGIGFTQSVYCNPGDEILYPTPGFPIYESLAHYLELNAIPITLKEENDFVLQATDLEEKLSSNTKLIILNSPSNPTGSLIDRSEMEKIAEVILSKCDPNVRIFSDEIYEDILYDGHQHFSIASLPGMEERTIISSGFSKSFAWTGGRIGYLIVPSVKEAEVFTNLNNNYFSCLPPYNQEAAALALNHPEGQRFITSMVKTLESRRNYCLEALRSIPSLQIIKPKGALYLFPKVQQICDELGISDAYEKLNPKQQALTTPATLLQTFALTKHFVATLDRRSFGIAGSALEPYLRLSFATNKSVLTEGIARLKEAFQDTKGFQRFMKEGF